MKTTQSRSIAVACGVALAALVWSGAAGKEQVLGGGARALVSEAALPGIDRGLRDQDIVRDPDRSHRRPSAG